MGDLAQTTRIARAALRAGLKAIVFSGSRLQVEVIAKYLKDAIDRDPLRPSRVLAYRGGYLPSERRTAERAMRAGSVSGRPSRTNRAGRVYSSITSDGANGAL